ncbi:MAG: LL-diaminopimelate aminotransferase [Firmicutes bacterium]|nr:LL-diaminopimelate aminotransferase [Bacillota bacterium]
MVKLNDNFQKLPGGYLFPEIARRVREFQNPAKPIIRLGIGDVTLPLPPAVVEAMKKAAGEMGHKETFHGYCDNYTNGAYDFLRFAIRDDYRVRGLDIADDEIFVSDGAKSDCGNIGDLFSADCRVAVCDPVYPVYVDVSAMAGRAGDFNGARWSRLIYLPCTAENGFFPALPEEKADLIFLCSPNNPTGAAATKEQLRLWVDYANDNGSVLLYDGAYEAFITEDDRPHSIYELPGADTCAIEFRTFSKTAGFTGVRCGYTVIPKALVRDGARLRDMWNRRQGSKFNGVSYIVQRGAEASLTPEGRAQCRENIAYYLDNARVIREGLARAGLSAYGGVNAPYIWAKTPEGVGSWEFFDKLLYTACVVTTPGAGFGPSGEGYIRLTAFGDADATAEAVERIRAVL